MAQPEYDTLTDFWTNYEQGIRDMAAAENDDPGDAGLAVTKALFYQGAYLTLRILNRAGLIDDSMPRVAALMAELQAVRIVVPPAESAVPMTPDHPQWDAFLAQLAGPAACHFRHEPPESTRLEDFKWTCGGGTDKSFTLGILTEMGLDAEAIAESVDYFDAHGGYCDCEILFNVANGPEDGQ
jgi:hypothetical protein